MMRKIYISAWILISPLMMKAQQIPISSQPIANAYLFNPAAAGVQGYADLSIGGRQQWSGVSNAPQNTFVYFNSALGKKAQPDFSYLSLPISNPGLYQEIADAKVRPKHGLGGRIYGDTWGAFSETGVGLDYAFHLPLHPKWYLSLGLGFQVSNFAFDRVKAQVLEDNDPTYQNFLGNNESEIIYNGRFGLYLYGERLRLGYAANQLISNPLNSNENSSVYQGQRSHHFIHLSYRQPLAKWGFTPSTSFILTANAPSSAFVGLLIDYDRSFLVSVAYRNEGSMLLGAGFSIAKIIRLTYSYDFPISDLQLLSSGSHEILLKFMLNRNKLKQ